MTITTLADLDRVEIDTPVRCADGQLRFVTASHRLHRPHTLRAADGQVEWDLAAAAMVLPAHIVRPDPPEPKEHE